MSEYIERAGIVEDIVTGLTIVCPEVTAYADAVLEKIEQYPAADVKPVIRSEWEITDVDHGNGNKCFHCPECGEDEWRDDEPNYCPSCGAQMGGADNKTL